MEIPLEQLRISALNVRAPADDTPQDTPHGQVQDTPHGQVQDTPHGQVQDTPHGQVQDTPHGQVQDTPHAQVQGDEPEERTVEELAASIQEHGLLNPLSVRKVGDGFEVFAGQRRLQALRQLGWKSAPCRVVEVDDDGARARSLVENFQRKENTPAEKVRAFSALFNGPCKGDKKALMRLVGVRSERTVDRYLRLGTLVPQVLERLDDPDEPLSLAAADSLVDLSPEEQEEAAKSAVGPAAEKPKKPRKPSGPWLHSPNDGAHDPIPIAPEHLSAVYKYYMSLCK